MLSKGLWFHAAFPVTPQPRCPYQISSLLSSSSLPSPSSSQPIQVPGLLGLSILPASHAACAAPRRRVSSTWLRPRLGGRGSQHTSLLGCFNWTHAILKPTCWRAIDCWKKYLGFARPSHSLYITYRTVDGKNHVDSRRSICLPCTVGFLPRIWNEIKQSLGLPTFSALSFPVLLPQVSFFKPPWKMQGRSWNLGTANQTWSIFAGSHIDSTTLSKHPKSFEHLVANSRGFKLGTLRPLHLPWLAGLEAPRGPVGVIPGPAWPGTKLVQWWPHRYFSIFRRGTGWKSLWDEWNFFEVFSTAFRGPTSL